MPTRPSSESTTGIWNMSPNASTSVVTRPMYSSTLGRYSTCTGPAVTCWLKRELQRERHGDVEHKRRAERKHDRRGDHERRHRGALAR